MNTQVVPAGQEQHSALVAAGERFEFGKNWSKFLATLTDERIRAAERSLLSMVPKDALAGKTFLDIGSGSGLFSLAARRLGARVHSFDFDPYSVRCTSELRDRYYPDDSDWVVQTGSVLDASYMDALGRFDVVYSWGVLHHTGEMWRALDHAQALVAPGGWLFIAIYNDEGRRSLRWRAVKKGYNRLPAPLRAPYAALAMAPSELRALLSALLRGRFKDYLNYSELGADRVRGMSRWRDIVDWVGGYPYEFASPDAIFEFHRVRGFVLEKLRCFGAGSGCNEFVFRRVAHQ